MTGQRSNQCNCARNRKRRFRSKKEATHALHRIANRVDNRDRKPTRVYQCPACKGWFLTSSDQ